MIKSKPGVILTREADRVYLFVNSDIGDLLAGEGMSLFHRMYLGSNMSVKDHVDKGGLILPLELAL